MDEYNTPTIYVILKVHKNLTIPTGRPIISAIKGTLEQIGKFLDALIKGMVTELPSYVQDTRDELLKIMQSGPFSSVSTLSPFTPPSRMGAQNELILELLAFALNHNYFRFSGVNF